MKFDFNKDGTFDQKDVMLLINMVFTVVAWFR